MKEQDALLVLNAVPGLGAVKVKLLCQLFGSAAGVLKQDYAEILSSGMVTPGVAENIIHFSKDKFLLDEYNLARQKGVRVMTIADDDFPQSLRDIPGGPIVLYIQGDVNALYAASIAMVGSRICSHYGVNMAGLFAASFAQAGLVVVSGLARGIDTAAHQGCLKAGGRTIAVLGCGLDHVYPKENRSLMEAIGRQGAVVSELPMGTPPIPANFPRRNRIISGLTLTTLVVEAGAGSGALITADFALEQGRDVFVVPANVDHPSAQGSNRLIKDGAKVALTPGDVLDEFKGQLELAFPPPPGAREHQPVSLTEAEMGFYKCLTSEPMPMDELLLRTKQPLARAAQVLLNLELKGIVRQLPGKSYIKV
ncbi:MAG: DNA-protecting protein DprA [Candidatus Omnitrophica bacterium]|nr:DNA-protecting protein DprA [Candidatus Omnitrophota bacterium]